MAKFLFSNASDSDSITLMDPHQEGKQGPKEKNFKRWMYSLEDLRVFRRLEVLHGGLKLVWWIQTDPYGSALVRLSWIWVRTESAFQIKEQGNFTKIYK